VNIRGRGMEKSAHRETSHIVPFIIMLLRVTTSRIMRHMQYVAHKGKIINACRNLEGKPEENRPFGKN
jgi:hypothetical protein